MSQKNSTPEIFQSIIGSWYNSLKDPEKYQRLVLTDLVKEYCKTRYGQGYDASKIKELQILEPTSQS
jgi:hypothetical protein